MEMHKILVVQATEVRIEMAEPFGVTGFADIFDNVVRSMYALAANREVRSMSTKSIKETLRPNVIGSKRPCTPTVCAFFHHSPSSPPLM
jgi:hypothetical protein